MSENQLNSISMSQQPQNHQNQQLISQNQQYLKNGQNTVIEQCVAQNDGNFNEEGEAYISQNGYEHNYESLENYQQNMNDNFQNDKIILQNQEEQNHKISNSSSLKGQEQQKTFGNYERNKGYGNLNENILMNGNLKQPMEEVEVKILDEGYNNYGQQQQNVHNVEKNHQNHMMIGQQQQIIQEHMNAINGYANEIQNQIYNLSNGGQYQQSIPQPQSNAELLQPQKNNYNNYVQAVLNNPMNPAVEPSHEALEEIYNELKAKFPECMPEQIILLLYNTLIKIPREEMIEEQGQHFDQSRKYDGGSRYLQELMTSNNPNVRGQMASYQIRKQMVKIYVTKGYGLKVYQEQILAINPNAQPIDKEKFKSHFIAIYKITLKKVEEFLAHSANWQFEPTSKKQFNLSLGDVINCRKHYSPEFCEIFFRLIQATFDPLFDKDQVPNEGEAIFFLRAILEKVRQQKFIIVKKMFQPEQEKDTDIWSEEFQFHFIKLFILEKNILSAKIKLINQFPECENLLTDQKLKQKIENAIRVATRLLQIQNQNCGNSVAFALSDIDKKFIMTAPQLEQSRIKLLKVYIKKPKDPQVLSDIVSFINKQLKSKYEQQKVPFETLQKSVINQVPRTEEKAQLQNILKAQIMRNS